MRGLLLVVLMLGAVHAIMECNPQLQNNMSDSEPLLNNNFTDFNVTGLKLQKCKEGYIPTRQILCHITICTNNKTTSLLLILLQKCKVPIVIKKKWKQRYEIFNYTLAQGCGPSTATLPHKSKYNDTLVILPWPILIVFLLVVVGVLCWWKRRPRRNPQNSHYYRKSNPWETFIQQREDTQGKRLLVGQSLESS